MSEQDLRKRAEKLLLEKASTAPMVEVELIRAIAMDPCVVVNTYHAAALLTIVWFTQLHTLGIHGKDLYGLTGMILLIATAYHLNLRHRVIQ